MTINHLTTTPARVQKVVVPEDEVANGGYYTSPPMNVIAAIASVPDFIVGRKGYGMISFKYPVDLTEVISLSMLCEIVEIERGRATVYPDESKKPSAGTDLNVPAEVTLENVRPPPDFEDDEYIEELREISDTTSKREYGGLLWNTSHPNLPRWAPTRVENPLQLCFTALTLLQQQFPHKPNLYRRHLDLLPPDPLLAINKSGDQRGYRKTVQSS